MAPTRGKREHNFCAEKFVLSEISGTNTWRESEEVCFKKFLFGANFWVVRECFAQMCAALIQHLTLHCSPDRLGPEFVFEQRWRDAHKAEKGERDRSRCVVRQDGHGRIRSEPVAARRRAEEQAGASHVPPGSRVDWRAAWQGKRPGHLSSFSQVHEAGWRHMATRGPRHGLHPSFGAPTCCWSTSR